MMSTTQNSHIDLLMQLHTPCHAAREATLLYRLWSAKPVAALQLNTTASSWQHSTNLGRDAVYGKVKRGKQDLAKIL